MKKKIYLIILLTVWFECWDIMPYGHLSGVMKLVVSLIVMCQGFFMYYSPAKMCLLKSYLMKPFWWIMAGIILSAIPAYLYFGQSYTQSFITYRSQLLWLVIPLLLIVSPTEKDVVDAAKWTTVLMAGVYYLRLFMPTMFVIDLEQLGDRKLEDMYLEGISIATIPIFYYLTLLCNRFRWNYLIIIIFCYAYIFIMQNRSTLLPVTLLILVSLLRIRSQYRFVKVCTYLVLVAFVTIQMADYWIKLYEETRAQLSDQDYNRVIAFHYFLFEANHNWVTYILGNGYLSSNVTTLVQDQMQRGIYNSDMGFIGFWNQYGIIPIIVFTWLMLIPLIRRTRYSWYLKLWALQMLMCSLTISYFASNVHMIYFALYYYMFILYYVRYDRNRTCQLSHRVFDSPLRK